MTQYQLNTPITATWLALASSNHEILTTTTLEDKNNPSLKLNGLNIKSQDF